MDLAIKTYSVTVGDGLSQRHAHAYRLGEGDAKITKAMQMVAAAKLRRAQEAAPAARPYAQRMDRVLANLGAPSPTRKARRRCWSAPAGIRCTCSSS